jgi:hypothetical protein
MSLPNSDFLGTIVGVSATFIGFSLVVGFLRADDVVVGDACSRCARLPSSR